MRAHVVDVETPAGRFYFTALEYGHPKASKAAWSRIQHDPEIRHRRDLSVWNGRAADEDRYFVIVVTQSPETMERAIEVCYVGGHPEALEEYPERMIDAYVNRRLRAALDVIDGAEAPIEQHFGNDGVFITRSGAASLDRDRE